MRLLLLLLLLVGLLCFQIYWHAEQSISLENYFDPTKPFRVVYFDHDAQRPDAEWAIAGNSSVGTAIASLLDGCRAKLPSRSSRYRRFDLSTWNFRIDVFQNDRLLRIECSGLLQGELAGVAPRCIKVSRAERLMDRIMEALPAKLTPDD